MVCSVMKICCRVCSGSKTTAMKKISHVGQVNPALSLQSEFVTRKEDLQSNLNSFCSWFPLALPAVREHEQVFPDPLQFATRCSLSFHSWERQNFASSCLLMAHIFLTGMLHLCPEGTYSCERSHLPKWNQRWVGELECFDHSSNLWRTIKWSESNFMVDRSRCVRQMLM